MNEMPICMYLPHYTWHNENSERIWEYIDSAEEVQTRNQKAYQGFVVLFALSVVFGCIRLWAIVNAQKKGIRGNWYTIVFEELPTFCVCQLAFVLNA